MARAHQRKYFPKRVKPCPVWEYCRAFHDVMNLLPLSSAVPIAVSSSRWDSTPCLLPQQHSSSPLLPNVAEEMLRLLESIYQAAHDSSLWTNVLQEIADAVHADTAILAAPTDDHSVFVGGFHAASWHATLRERMGIERPERGRELVLGRNFSRPAGDDTMERISLYCDIPSAGQLLHAMGQKISSYGEPYLLVVRRKECGTFGQDEQCIFATLAPHLANALSLHLRMASAQVQVECAHAVLNAFEHAVLRLDRTGHVHFISHAADILLRTISEVQVKDGRLHMATVTLQGALAAAIHAVTATSPHGKLCQSFTVQRHDETSLQVTLFHLPLLSSSSAEIMVLLTYPHHGENEFRIGCVLEETTYKQTNP